MRQFVLWYEARVGPARFAELVQKLPDWALEDLDPTSRGLGLVSTTWYQDLVVFALLDAIAAQVDPKERDRIAVEGAAAVMDATLSGVYKTLFRLMTSPERYAKYGPKLWDTYYDSGTFVIVPTADRHGARCTITGWQTHHPLICDINRGASIAIYQAMGCGGVACVRESCVAQGSDACRFLTTWKTEK